MDANYAAQSQWIRLAEQAYLEFMPDTVIPHRGSRFLSETRISVAPSATLLYSEILLPGRKYHHDDEYFGFDVFSSNVAAERPDGRALFTEKFVVEPRQRALRQAGVMGSFDVFGNVVLLTPKEHALRIHAEIGAGWTPRRGWPSSDGRLPNDAGLVFKVLGMESHPVKKKIREFWAVARRTVLGRALAPEFLWR
jgi:urease accessory protein